VFATLAAFSASFAWTTPAAAQAPAAAPKKPDPAPAAVAPAAGKKEEKPALPDAEEMTLETKDNVQLRCTYFPSTLEKKAVPVILVHGWLGSRKDYDGLARYLQKAGHAVLTLDLRGHGESKTRKVLGGKDEELDAVKEPMKFKKEIPLMTVDIERAKKFLREENNEGRCNIDLLCVVASDFGAIVAAEWAIIDWSWPMLASGKQGQDVKGLVFLSPPATQQAKPMPKLATSNIRAINYMILVGNADPKALGDAKARLYNTLERFHFKVDESLPKEKQIEERLKNQSLFLVEFDTKLQGAKLLTDNNLAGAVALNIARFIQLRMVAKADEYPWAMR
jgi:pimeloyl-ACP methyl ester carboxylesterase